MSAEAQQAAMILRHHFEQMCQDKWPTIADRGKVLLRAFETYTTEMEADLAAARKPPEAMNAGGD